MGKMGILSILTSFSLSDIFVDGCVFRPPVMDLTAPILYHILECGFESTNLQREKSERLTTHLRSIIHYLPPLPSPPLPEAGGAARGELGREREGGRGHKLLIDAGEGGWRSRQAARNKTLPYTRYTVEQN